MIQSLKMIKKVERTPYETFKMVVSFGLGIAVDTAVTIAMKQLIPVTRGWKGLLAKAGVFVLSFMVGEKAEEYVYVAFDDTKNICSEVKQNMLMPGDETEGDAKDGGGK